MFGGKRETPSGTAVRVHNQAPPQTVHPSSTARAEVKTTASPNTASAPASSTPRLPPTPQTNPQPNPQSNPADPTQVGLSQASVLQGRASHLATMAAPTHGQAKPAQASLKQNTANSGGAVLSSRENRTLTVGRSIKLRGEIAACDHLIVEGEVDAETAAAAKLEISREGTVRGNATVDTASVTGTFEGKLAVKGLLFVEAGGKVSGEVTCGELEVRRGGKVEGSLAYSGKAED